MLLSEHLFISLFNFTSIFEDEYTIEWNWRLSSILIVCDSQHYLAISHIYQCVAKVFLFSIFEQKLIRGFPNSEENMKL